MTLLREIAEELGAHERTLRRGLASGLVRGRRPTPRTVELEAGELRYLRSHWRLLSALREALRTERGVRLAVLIGSAARGELRDRSDIDVLIDAVDGGWRECDRLAERLSGVAGRPVDLVSLDAARLDPTLLDAAIHEGRVLIDRDGLWESVLADAPKVARAARRAGAQARQRLHALIAQLSEDE
jgi:predicted nucleotidyltransferase